MKLLNIKTGWRTYATIAVGFGLAGYQYFTGTDLSTHWYVLILLTALGFNRAGVANDKAETLGAVTAVMSLIQDVSSQVSVPSQTTVNAPTASSVTVSGATVTEGKPTPTNLPEKDVTAALNKLEASK